LPFLTPDADVVSIIDAAPTPLASPSPTEQFAILLHYQAHRQSPCSPGRG